MDLKSQTNWLFVQQLVQANNQVNIKAPLPLSFAPATVGFPLQRASNAESVYM